MPRDEAEASGKSGLATYRNADWRKFVAAVRYLPVLARDEGTTAAIAYGKTTLRSRLAFFDLKRAESKEGAVAQSAVGAFFEDAPLRLMCDDDEAGYRFATDFITVVEREYFLPSARAVFERAQEKEAAYAPVVQ